MQVKKTNQIENHFIKAVIYGESKSGKTTLAGTLNGPTVVISGESGLLTLNDKDLDYVELSHDENDATIKEPALRFKRLIDIYKWLEGGTKYKNVFIDSLTEISEIVVAHCEEKYPDAGDGFKKWGEYNRMMRGLIKGFRDMRNYHVFMTCLSEVDKDENGRRFQAFKMSGKVGSDLPQYFDEVFYLWMDEKQKRWLITEKSEKLFAGDRSRRLDPMEEADLGIVMGKILAPRVAKKTNSAKVADNNKEIEANV